MEPSKNQSAQSQSNQSWFSASLPGWKRQHTSSSLLDSLLARHAQRVGVVVEELSKAQRVARKIEQSCGCAQAFRSAIEDAIGNNDNISALLTYGNRLKPFADCNPTISSNDLIHIAGALQFTSTVPDSSIGPEVRTLLLDLFKQGCRGRLLRYAGIIATNLLVHDQSMDESKQILSHIADLKARFDVLGDLSREIALLSCKKELFGFLVTSYNLALELSELTRQEVAYVLPKWRQALSFTLQHGSAPIQITANLNRYLEEDSNLKFAPLLLRASVLAALGNPLKIETLPRSVSIIADHQQTAPLLETIQANTKTFNADQAPAVVSMLENVATHAIASTLITLKTAEAAADAGRLFAKLHDSEKSLTVDVTAVPILERLYDIFHGFGAFAEESKRGPNRESSLIAQFGQELGSLMFINAQDIAAFPGRGMLIHKLAVDKIFNASGLGAYQKAWPHLAPLMGDLGKTDFALMRGAIVIANSHPRFNHRYNEDLTYSYGLVVLNDHFHNPGATIGYLVDRKLLAQQFKSCLVSGSDSTGGWAPGVNDINRTGFSPEWLHFKARAGDGSVIPIEGGEALLSGFSGNSNLAETAEYREALKNFQDVTNAIRNNGFNRLQFPNESSGSRRSNFFPFRSNDEMLNATASESKKLQEAHARVQELHNRIVKRGQARTVEEIKIRSMIEAYLNLWDLFKIAYSFWKKGQTFTKSFTEFTAQTPIAPSHSAKQQSSSVVFGSSQDSSLNPESIRMLNVAYDYHAQRLDGVTNREKFKVLASASTLRSREVPNGDFWLDSYSMTGKLGGKSFSLSSNVRRPDIDDAAFWWNNVMPAVSGTSKDLRLFHPEVLKLLETK